MLARVKSSKASQGKAAQASKLYQSGCRDFYSGCEVVGIGSGNNTGVETMLREWSTFENIHLS